MRCTSRSCPWVGVVPTLCAMICLGSGAVVGQTTPVSDSSNPPVIPQIKPEENGLIVPRAGAVRPGNDRCVMVNDGSAGLVVAKVLVEKGDRVIAKLPNGRLTSVLARDATTTDRPYLPATKQDLTKELSEKFPQHKIRSTKRFLYAYNTSELFYQGTSRILETMYQPLFDYWKRLKVPVQDPDTPLVVVMFRTDDEFQKYKKMPDGVVAYYNGINNQVVMYEQSSLVSVAPELAVKQAVATVAHEGCHQILANIGVQQRLSDWPMWISEGLPEYFSPTSIDKNVRWKGVGLVNDLRMKEIDGYLKANGRVVKPGQVFNETIKAQGLTSTGYAFAWGLTHFLAERKKEKFAAFLTDVAKLQPLVQTTAADAEKLFNTHFGDEVAQLERELAIHLTKLPYVDPLETLTHYVCMMQTGGMLGTTSKEVLVTFSPASVKQWQTDQSKVISASARRFDIRSFPTRTQARNFALNWVNSP